MLAYFPPSAKYLEEERVHWEVATVIVTLKKSLRENFFTSDSHQTNVTIGQKKRKMSEGRKGEMKVPFLR